MSRVDRLEKIGAILGLIFLLMSINADVVPQQPWVRQFFLFGSVLIIVGMELHPWLRHRKVVWIITALITSLPLFIILAWWSENRTRPLKPKLIQCQAERLPEGRILIKQASGTYDSGIRPWSDFVSILFVQPDGFNEQILLTKERTIVVPVVPDSGESFQFPMTESRLTSASPLTIRLILKVASVFARDIPTLRDASNGRFEGNDFILPKLPLPTNEIRYIIYADDPCVVELGPLPEPPPPPAVPPEKRTQEPLVPTAPSRPDLAEPQPPPTVAPPTPVPTAESIRLRALPRERTENPPHPDIDRGEVERLRTLFEEHHQQASRQGRKDPHSTADRLPKLIDEALSLAGMGDPKPTCTMRQDIDHFASMDAAYYCDHVLPRIQAHLASLKLACPLFSPQIDPEARCR